MTADGCLAPRHPSGYPGLAGFVLNLDLAPIGWAFGLALVAAAFQIGTRMQKDTEALVRARPTTKARAASTAGSTSCSRSGA